jgi:type I restriction enzyme S subunit
MSSTVPEGWFTKSLDEIAVFIRDGTHAPHERLNQGVPLLSAKNIMSDGYISCDSGDSLISEVDYQKIHAKYVIEKNDLLVTVVGTLGRVALVPSGFQKFTLQRSVAILRLDQKAIYPELCYQYLKGDEFQRQLSLRSNSTAQAGVYLGELAKISIPVPPLPEQRKIASILLSVDEVIENTQKQIDKLQDLKKATMNELLTKGIGHTEFKDSELGRIPKSWEVVSLGQLAEVIDPQPDHRTPPSVDFGVPYVGMADVGLEGKIDFENARSVSATVLEEQIDRFDINSGAFLIGKIGTIGNASVLPEKRFYCLSANIILVSSKDISVQRFIYQVFKGAIIEKQIQDQTNTTSQPALGIKKVRDFLIPMPAQDERALIVSILSAIDEGIAVSKQKLSQTQSLKKSLMQDLLTGKVRVTVN